MEKGIAKTWTPEQEKYFKRAQRGCRTFAERYILNSLLTILKYDLRTKEGMRALAGRRLQLMTATDDDLREVAKLECTFLTDASPLKAVEIYEELKKSRDRLRAKGIKKAELEIRK